MKTEKDPFDHPFFKDTKKYMKRQIIQYTIIMLVFTIGVVFLIHKVANEADKERKITKSFVGKKVAIEKDTLTIIDYSTLTKTYKLSNGIDYDMDFVKSKIF
jgi:hypothetical protein